MIVFMGGGEGGNQYTTQGCRNDCIHGGGVTSTPHRGAGMIVFMGGRGVTSTPHRGVGMIVFMGGGRG